jgi:hypothetical protein
VTLIAVPLTQAQRPERATSAQEYVCTQYLTNRNPLLAEHKDGGKPPLSGAKRNQAIPPEKCPVNRPCAASLAKKGRAAENKQNITLPLHLVEILSNIPRDS